LLGIFHSPLPLGPLFNPAFFSFAGLKFAQFGKSLDQFHFLKIRYLFSEFFKKGTMGIVSVDQIKGYDMLRNDDQEKIKAKLGRGSAPPASSNNKAAAAAYDDDEDEEDEKPVKGSVSTFLHFIWSQILLFPPSLHSW
jgi:hypothetical protein